MSFKLSLRLHHGNVVSYIIQSPYNSDGIRPYIRNLVNHKQKCIQLEYESDRFSLL